LVISLIEIDTQERREVIDITSHVEEALKESGVKKGICLIFTTHTTTALTVNEAEPELMRDLLKKMISMVPKGEGYGHDESDGNAHAHIQAALLGNSAVLPVEGGSLTLGTWQRVLFLELDGPRKRRVLVRGISE
jgi:secondary thiamine-phosphate synthase enzyme